MGEQRVRAAGYGGDALLLNALTRGQEAGGTALCCAITTMTHVLRQTYQLRRRQQRFLMRNAHDHLHEGRGGLTCFFVVA